MNKPIIINLFAGPGAGKSTTAAAVFSLLKMHGIDAELVTEFAKDLTWEERYQALANQYYVWGKQYHKIWRLKNKVDVIVTDCPLLLSLVYGEDKLECFHETVIKSFNMFNNVNYFIMRKKKFNPNGRNETEKEANKLDNDILFMLDTHEIKYKVVSGDYEGANNIAKRLLHYLGKKMYIRLCTADDVDTNNQWGG